MDLDYDQFACTAPLDMSDVVIGTDLSEIVDSICNDGEFNLATAASVSEVEASRGGGPEGFPDSPPDSGSEHLLSPSSMVNPGSVGGIGYSNLGASIGDEPYPDLNKVNYSLPMQMIDEDYKVLI